MKASSFVHDMGVKKHIDLINPSSLDIFLEKLFVKKHIWGQSWFVYTLPKSLFKGHFGVYDSLIFEILNYHPETDTVLIPKSLNKALSQGVVFGGTLTFPWRCPVQTHFCPTKFLYHGFFCQLAGSRGKKPQSPIQ